MTWKKVKGIKGYELQYSLKKNFKGAKTKTIKKVSTTTVAIKKLKRKKKYYVRIRTYIVSNRKKIYSDWSKFKVKKPNSNSLFGYKKLQNTTGIFLYSGNILLMEFL